MCGCNEYMNSGVLVDEMESTCVMYYLHVPYVVLNISFNLTRISLSRTQRYFC